MKITKEEFEKLYSPDVTKREFDAIVRKIEDRFSEIVLTMIPKIKSRGWFDWANCDYEAEDSGGQFDPDDYKENIGVGGEYANLPEPYNSELTGENEFPTRWLWEDFEEEFRREVAKSKADEIERRSSANARVAELKQLKAQYKASAMKKLTAEEAWACGLDGFPRSLKKYEDVK